MIYDTTKHRQQFPQGTPAFRFATLLQEIATTDDAATVAEFEEMAQTLGAEVAEHLESMLELRGNILNTCQAIDIEIERLQELKHQRQARAQRIHDAVIFYMDMIDSAELVTDTYTLRVKKNPPRVDIYDEILIPAEYLKRVEKVETKVDKKAIADAIKNGVTVEGATLVQTKRLEIK